MTTTQTTQNFCTCGKELFDDAAFCVPCGEFANKLWEAQQIADAHGPYEYGDTSNPISRVRYEESVRLLDIEIENCRYCKAAKTRTAKARACNFQLTGRSISITDVCGEHRARQRANYYCSPVSETYWCS